MANTVFSNVISLLKALDFPIESALEIEDACKKIEENNDAFTTFLSTIRRYDDSTNCDFFQMSDEKIKISDASWNMTVLSLLIFALSHPIIK